MDSEEFYTRGGVGYVEEYFVFAGHGCYKIFVIKVIYGRMGE